MAKKFVRISLATKFRLLYGAAVVGVIAVALAVPWYFMELLGAQSVERAATAVAHMRLAEWHREHQGNAEKARDAGSAVLASYSRGRGAPGRSGPSFVRLKPRPDNSQSFDGPMEQAVNRFIRSPRQDLVVLESRDEQGVTVYRCFLPVRAEPSCVDCHKSTAENPTFDSGELVAMIDVGVPASEAEVGDLVWGTRLAFLVGALLAGLLAFLIFSIITHRLVLRPVRRLRDVADKVAEGSLSVRSTVATGDELERLGESFNEMLDAIAAQTEQLRSANSALDARLNELAEANVTLFQANQVKSEFLANVSHELRTPLNSIIGFADLLGESQEERIRRYGQNISTAAKNLLSMINDLLDLAKIEAGKAEVRLDKVSVAETCRTLAALIGPLADKKRLKLEVGLADDLPLVVTDAGKLQQILYNLLSNAVKFTPPGGQVTLSADVKDVRRGGHVLREVHVSVADTGPGIAEADQQHIFEKFYQVDRTLTKESSGTGLGLAISKELTQLLGGRLTLRSEPGGGALFTVRLPVQPPSWARPADSAEP